jgi:hypothetical protein
MNLMEQNSRKLVHWLDNKTINYFVVATPFGKRHNFHSLSRNIILIFGFSQCQYSKWKAFIKLYYVWSLSIYGRNSSSMILLSSCYCASLNATFINEFILWHVHLYGEESLEKMILFWYTKAKWQKKNV